VTGCYIHDDGTECRHGIDPDSLDALDAHLDTPDQYVVPPPVHCQAGRALAGWRLDPDKPVPP
jgi:hypothetical protein